MIVALDTTETFADLRMDGPNFKLLKAYLVRTSSTMAVPEIVFEETVNHFREQITKLVNNANIALSEIASLTATGENAKLLRVDIDDAVKEFREYLLTHVKSFHGELIPFSEIGVGKIVQRSLKRQKPFDAEGRRGFRDAVIWESILGQLDGTKGTTTIAFLSRNSKDFGKNGVLHETLLNECASVGASNNSVILYDGLQAFIDAEVKPKLETLDAIYEQLNEEGSYQSFDIYDFFLSNSVSIKVAIQNHLNHGEFERVTGRCFGRLHSPRVESIDIDPSESKVADVWHVDETLIAVGIDYVSNGTIECLHEQECFMPYEDEVFGELYDEPFTGDVVFKVSMTIIINKEEGDVIDYEVNDIKTELGRRWPWQ